MHRIFLLLFILGFGKFHHIHSYEKISAKSAIVLDKISGKILFEKNAHDKFYPASITKIATAIYILETVSDLNQYTTPSSHALETVKAEKKHNDSTLPPYILEHDGTMMQGLSSKRSVLLQDLLYGLMLNSGNNAANILAESLFGDISVFMDELNLFLQSKGLKNTQFFNPHGLHYPGHISTAYDLALLTKHALDNPTFKKIVSSISYQPYGSAEKISHFNQLVQPGKKYYYPKAIGVKTGYTQKAGYNLVAAAEDENRCLIAVLLGCEKSSDRYVDAISLFEKFFTEKKESKVLFSENQIFEKTLLGADKPMLATLHEDIVAQYFPSEKPNFSAYIEWTNLTLPIHQNQVVGNLIIKDQDTKLSTTKIYSTNCVKKTLSQKIKDFFK